jgi:hypothetical protein
MKVKLCARLVNQQPDTAPHRSTRDSRALSYMDLQVRRNQRP